MNIMSKRQKGKSQEEKPDIHPSEQIGNDGQPKFSKLTVLKDRIGEKKEWIVLGVMAVIIFCFGIYKLLEVGQPIIFCDEVGYWANSSFFLGQDWSSVASNINYYSYGYSLLLVLVRLLTNWLSWDWRQMYETVVVMQSLMLVGGFAIARKLCQRYLPDFHWLVRDFACFAAALYPTYIVYTHIGWTETLLVFLVWVFLYGMMRLIDKPTVLNHVCFALLSFYMYAVHQRCLAAVVVAVLIVLYMRLLKENSLKQTAVFLGTAYLCNLVHTMIKRKLQNDFYLAQEPADWQDTLGYALNKNALMLLAAVVVCLICLYAVERGWSRVVICAGLIALAAGCVYLKLNIDSIQDSANAVTGRIAGNDFAGQLKKVMDVFTLSGFLRLLISIAGKWFYLASATGLIVCFAIWNLTGHALLMAWDGIKRLWSVIRKKDYVGNNVLQEHKKEDIWFVGVFLLWLGAFAICAVYIMAIDRAGDLMYGRYQEYAACFLIVYGFYNLLKDKRWIRHMALFVAAYLAIGALSQYILNELGPTNYPLSHSVMLGRVFVDGEEPNGKVWELVGHAVSFGIAICLLAKAEIDRFPKALLCRRIAALMIGICVWAHMGMAIVDDYVLEVNYRQEAYLPTIAMWINRLSFGENIYYLRDTRDYRWGVALQYNLFDRKVTMVKSNTMPHGEDAFYVSGASFGESEQNLQEFAIIVKSGNFTLFTPKEGAIYERMMAYKFSQY